MVFINIIFIVINLSIVFIGYFIVNNKIEKKLVNKKVLNSIKEEINSIIIKLNETTLNNISIIEEKKKSLDKKIILADKKKAGLESVLLNNEEKSNTDILFSNDNLKFYNPKEIIKQNKKNIVKDDINNDDNKKSIDDELKELSMAEKVTFLFKKGWKLKEIQKKIGISSGELELLINIENIKELAYDL